MARFVLLHSPLLGPLSWRATAAELARRGRAAGTPAWPKLSGIEAGYYDALVEGMAAQLGEAGAGLMLVAHSGAGALVPALSARLGDRVAGAIFADAILPHPGRSWFDTAPAELRQQLRAGAQMGELPPWDQWWPPGAIERLVPEAGQREALLGELEPLPVGYFEEPAPEDRLNGPTAYLQLSGAYADEAEAAMRNGWPLVRLPLHHLAMLTHPEAIAAALDSLAARLAEPTHG